MMEVVVTTGAVRRVVNNTAGQNAAQHQRIAKNLITLVN